MRTVLLAITGMLAASSLAIADDVKSGLKKGDGVRPTNPRHVAGPKKGSKACPV